MTDARFHWVTTPSGFARRHWRVLVESGPDQGRFADLTTTPALIGAAPGSVIALQDDTVSRYHAEVDLMAAGLRIRDLRSTNGTFLADREGPVNEGFLWAGSRFRLGETWLRVEAHDEPAARFRTPADPVKLGGLVGRSPVMQAVFRSARRLARSDGPVLVVGPVGSGRAAIARQMQRLSPRSDQPFVTVEAEPDATSALLERDDRSLLLRADQGTLLLRNVDRFPRRLQVSLREVIERGTIHAGDSRRVDIRFFATCTAAGDVEPTLRRHLGVAQLEIPPLGARPDEIVPLAEHFIHGAGWKQIRLGPRTRQRLGEVAWPDQVAGLSRLVQRLALPPDTADDGLEGLPALRHAFLSDLLAHHGGDVTAASLALSMPQDQLFRTLHVCDVDLD